MRTIVGGFAAGAVALLAACGNPTPPAPPVLLGALPPTFDGIYPVRIATSATSKGSNPVWCATSSAATITVSDGRFDLALPHPNVPGNPVIHFAVDIVPGGTFQNQSDNGTALITGHIRNGYFEAVVDGSGCEYSVTATGA